MSLISADWEAYAHNTFTWMIRAYYFFTVWRNYILLLRGLKIPQGTLLEIGSSTGQISLRIAKKYSLKPTLIDTSHFALHLAKRLFLQSNLRPTLICQDVLNLSLDQYFDFVHSNGLLEHFKGANQKNVFRNHVKYIRSGGWLVCWVPTPDRFYRINRWYLERTNQWIFGYEKPLPLKDFILLFQREGLQIQKICHPPGWLGIAAQKSQETLD